MENCGIYSLIPIAVVLLSAIILRRVGWALLLGIIVGSFTASHFTFIQGCKNLLSFLWFTFSDIQMLIIALFVIIMGAFLTIISFNGAINTFSYRLSKWVNSDKKSLLATWVIGILIFFSDYGNLLINSSSMKKICEKNKVSPGCFAYITNSVCTIPSIMLISTWAVFQGTLMIESGAMVGIKNTLTGYLIAALPYHMSTYFIFFLSLLVALTGKWFSTNWDKKYRLSNEPILLENTKTPLSLFLLPMITMIVLSITCFLLSGYFIVLLKGKTIDINHILNQAKTIESLVISAIVSLVLAFILTLKHICILKKALFLSILKGILGMLPLCLVILLANGFAEVSSHVGAGKYIASQIEHFVKVEYLPLIVFLISLCTNTATGYSWGTMAIMMPFAFNFTVRFDEALIPIISAAVISGSIVGGQIIPYSDRIIINAKICDISPFYHLKTLLPQILPIIVITSICYLILGYTRSLLLSYAVGFTSLFLFHIIFSKKIFISPRQPNKN